MLQCLLLILFLLLLAPVKAGAVLFADREGVRGKIGVMVWGVRLQAEVRLCPGGSEIRFRGKPLPPLRRRKGTGPVFRGQGWGLLKRGVRVLRAEAACEIGFQDAAAAALLTGLVRAVSGFVPVLKLTARPGPRFALAAKCIAESRLGILWAAYALRLWGRGRKEDKAWIIPSAA